MQWGLDFSGLNQVVLNLIADKVKQRMVQYLAEHDCVKIFLVKLSNLLEMLCHLILDDNFQFDRSFSVMLSLKCRFPQGEVINVVAVH